MDGGDFTDGPRQSGDRRGLGSGASAQLEDRYAASIGDRGVLEPLIIATSLQFGVLCRFTAYVAIDRAAVVNEGGELHQVTQPVEMPAGWDAARELSEVCMLSPLMASPDECYELAGPPSMSAPASSRRGRMFALKAALAPPSPSSALAYRKAVPPVPPPPSPSTTERLMERRRELGGYELLEELGDDGHGTRYRGQDQRKRPVLVRLLEKPVAFAAAGELAAVEKALKGLKHAGIVPILKLVTILPSGPVIAVVSDYVVGATLAERFAGTEPLDPRAAAQFVLALAEALEYAGGRGVIHGNLTPDHILIGDNGQPRISGFGLLRLECRPDVSCATVRTYVAPEISQSPGAGPTAQSDVYSLGVMFYRLLTGVLPDRGLGNGDPVSPRVINPGVPAELEAICLKALAGELTARYGKASELAIALREFLGIKKRGLIGRLRGKPKAGTAPTPTEKEEREGFWK